MNGMDNSYVKLTICIPTYNRKEKLLQCLDHLCPHITNEILVIVRDNASSNYNCKEEIQPYVHKYGIQYVRNDVNVGMEGNIAKCFEFCETQWLWILGDDDWINSSAVKLVLDAIDKNPQALFIKFNSYINSTTVGLDEFCLQMQPSYAFSNSYFISEGIHNLGIGKEDMIWHYKYMSTNIGQILRVLKHLISNAETECVFIKDSILEDHGGNISWSHLELVFSFLYVFDIFNEYKSKFKNNIFKCISRLSLAYIQGSNLSLKEKLYYAKIIVYKYGYINTLRYNLKQILSFYYNILIKNK